MRVCVCVCVCVSEGEGNLLATHTIKTDVYCIRIQLQTYVFRRNVLGDKSKLRDIKSWKSSTGFEPALLR